MGLFCAVGDKSMKFGYKIAAGMMINIFDRCKKNFAPIKMFSLFYEIALKSRIGHFFLVSW